MVTNRSSDAATRPERGDGRRDTGHDDRDARRYAWRVLSATSLGVLLMGLNSSTLDVALPTVARHFGASPTAASWLLLSYLLVTTVLILSFGRLADIVGRRRLYLAGLATFTVASLCCGLTPGVWALVGLRAVQAAGAAAVVTNTTALLTDAFPRDLLSTALGTNVTVVAAGQVLGPLIGGAVASGAGWRWVFWFNVPLGAVASGWAFRVLRRPVADSRPKESFDLVGAVMSLTLLAGLVLALSEGGAHGWGSPVVLTGAAVAVGLAPVFVALQRRRRFPLVDLTLFHDRERTMAYVAAFLLSVARFAVVLLVSLYLQAARGLDAYHAGLQVLPVAAGMMVASPLAGRLARRWSARVLSTAGLLLTGAGLAVLAVIVQPRLSGAALVGCLVAIGAGSGLFLTPNTSSIMASVPQHRRGIANGLRSMLQNTGFVVSTALTLALVTSPLPAGEKAAAYAGTLSSLPRADLDRFTGGYRLAFGVLAAMTVVGAVASLLRNPPPAGANSR